jgi:hypothetical protein
MLMASMFAESGKVAHQKSQEWLEGPGTAGRRTGTPRRRRNGGLRQSVEGGAVLDAQRHALEEDFFGEGRLGENGYGDVGGVGDPVIPIPLSEPFERSFSGGGCLPHDRLGRRDGVEVEGLRQGRRAAAGIRLQALAELRVACPELVEG